MLVGAAIALSEEFHRSAPVRPELLYLAGALLVTPSGKAALELFRGRGTQPQVDVTPGQSSSPGSPSP